MRFRKANHPESYWLPSSGIVDKLTGFYAIHVCPGGKMEACTAPGLWAEISDDKKSFYLSLLQKN